MFHLYESPPNGRGPGPAQSIALTAMGARRRLVLGAVVAWVAAPSAAQHRLPECGRWEGEPVNRPACASALAPRSPILALCRAGDTVVAAGERGHVLTSGDEGRSWVQASVPASVTLTALDFLDARRGFVCGHQGLVMSTVDGGRTWTRRIDARSFGAQMASALDAVSEQAAAWRNGARDKPLFALRFADNRRGLAVGAFGLALASSDAGETWAPAVAMIENPKGLHLYGVVQRGDGYLVVGEQGFVAEGRLETGLRRIACPYGGSLFGAVDTGAGTLVYGLRGHALLLRPDGSWMPVPTETDRNLVGAIVAAPGAAVLVDERGHWRALDLVRGRIVARDDSASFPAAAMVGLGDGSLLIAGPRGLSIEAGAGALGRVAAAVAKAAA